MIDDECAVSAPEPCTHADLLRGLASRLVAVGGPVAELALAELTASTEAHTQTVEAVMALLDALESAASTH